LVLSCTVSEIRRLIGWQLPIFPTPLIWHPRCLSSFWNFALKLTQGNQSHGATLWWTLHDPNFDRFWLIHPCDRQTDRRADGRAIAYSALSIMLSRAENGVGSQLISLLDFFLWTGNQNVSFHRLTDDFPATFDVDIGATVAYAMSSSKGGGWEQSPVTDKHIAVCQYRM